MKNVFCFLLLTFSISSMARLSLTTSGGVSLGVYEAGFLYYSMYLEKNLPKRRDENLIITGASAGAINSFITAIERCSDLPDLPQKSLFWKSWIPLNFDKFFIKRGSGANSLLQRNSLEDLFDNVEDRWKSGLKKGCSSTLGMTITRKTPYELKENSKLKYTRVQEYLVFKMTGRGEGKSPLVENVYLKETGSQMFLPFNLDGFDNFSLIKNALLASSSFPIAFEPMSLNYCMVHNPQITTCLKEAIEKDLFLDGGIFNNAPLDLAYSIAKNDSVEKDTTFIYFDPSIKDYPIRSEDDFSNIDPGIIQDFFKFIQNFITSSRGGQISDFLRNHPRVNDQLYVLKGTMPLASEPLYGFFGFFEEDFRIFDFYMGMLDAKRASISKYEPKSAIELNQYSEHMLALECLDAVFNNHYETINYCSKIIDSKFENFSALFQVSIESLFNNCANVLEGKVVENKICKIAQSGKGPEVFDKNWDKSWKKYKDESQLSYIMRRLGHYEFRFKDLDAKGRGSDIALVKVKEKMTKAVKYSAKNQPRDHGILMNQLASPLMNYLFYSPKQKINYLLVGNNSFNIGSSSVMSSSELSSLYWRYGFGLMLTGIDLIYRPEVSGLGIVPYFGLYAEPTSFSTPLLQYRFGIRAGYQFSTKNELEVGKCPINSRSTNDFSRCSDFLVSGVFNLTIFETIRSEIVLSTLPLNDGDTKRPVYLSVMAGLQF
ncbi:patatin-like phospholipase family protein [Halobacteriovorax sp. JY17]|uniref:patatin-like phospholipase family protein n=1 Tax=Halobacteriovorax sp. JY17 TaxID=2014617 RepID=UPI000C546F5F|nr:patatin-like phospholipase family protein [Halobacteriovorax sp. JY17]PIK13795.1 MAG: hypothetical protein CES88_12465 [Halobacteriovorax sp. JY17]